MKTLARAATELQIMKPTQLGMDLPYDWEESDAFVKHQDESLFGWCDRYRCYQHLIYGIVSIHSGGSRGRGGGGPPPLSPENSSNPQGSRA
ncbi:unnamed protein product [Rhodiola kirilowii]